MSVRERLVLSLFTGATRKQSRVSKRFRICATSKEIGRPAAAAEAHTLHVASTRVLLFVQQLVDICVAVGEGIDSIAGLSALLCRCTKGAAIFSYCSCVQHGATTEITFERKAKPGAKDRPLPPTAPI